MRKFNSSLPFVTLLLALTTVPALAFHFPEPNVTAENMSILIVEFDIDGEPLSNGDEVGVFDPDDVCAGLGVVGDIEHGGGEEGELGVAAWADEGDTDQDEGFTAGDLIQYRIWDAHYEVEMIAVAESGDEGGDNFDSTWASNGFIMVALHARGIAIHRVQEIEHDFGLLDIVIDPDVSWRTSIENIGNARLIFRGVEVTGGFPLGDVSRSNLIEPGSSGYLSVRFPDPRVTMGVDYSGVLILYTNSPDSLIQFHLTGRIGAPVQELDRNEIDFGTISLESEMYGTPGWALDSLLVRNSGDATLLVNGVQCTSLNFYLPEGDPTNYWIAPGDSVYVKVIFRPEREEVYTGSLTWVVAASANGPYTVEVGLRGAGLTPISVGKEPAQAPLTFDLASVYPNPFNGVATIRFSLPASGDIRLAVYDLMGAELAVLAKGTLSAGEHSVMIESKDFPAGIYAARLMSGKSVAESRFVIVK